MYTIYHNSNDKGLGFPRSRASLFQPRAASKTRLLVATLARVSFSDACGE